MRKLFSTFGVATVCIALAGCGGGDSAPAPSTDAPAAEETAPAAEESADAAAEEAAPAEEEAATE